MKTWISTYLLSILCGIFLVQSVFAQELAPRPKVAVVLSGGGAKGFAHIGVLKVLEREGIPVDIVVGTSIGSIVGAMYAVGYSPAQIEQMSREQDWAFLLSDRIPRRFLSSNDQLLRQRYQLSVPFDTRSLFQLPSSVVEGQNLINYFCGIMGNVPEDADFNTFPRAFACVATDLEKGKEVVMHNGFLPTAIFSSMAIPGVFAPCEREGKFLADGGIVNNFPCDVARNMGADIIIGVDLRNMLATQEHLHSLPNILNQMISFYDPAQDSVGNRNCDILIRPDMTGFNASSFTARAVDSLILRGEQAANGLLAEIRELKSSRGLYGEKQIDSTYIKSDEWQISNIVMEGKFELPPEVIQKRLQLYPPGQYSSKQIKEAIYKLCGQESFGRVYFSLTDDSLAFGKKRLKFYLYEKNDYSLNIGFKVNTTDAAALLLNVNRVDYSKPLGVFSAGVELSANPGFSLLGKIYSRHLPPMAIEIDGKRQKYSIFREGEKDFVSDLYYASASCYMYQHFSYLYNMGVGYRQEYYHGDMFYQNRSESTVIVDNQNFIGNAYFYISFDNFDDFYFPTKGTSMYAEFSFMKNFINNNQKLTPVLFVNMRNVLPLSRKTAFLINIYSRALGRQDGFSPFKSTFVGGENFSSYFEHHFPFVGLPPVMQTGRYTDILLLGGRYRLSRNQYVSLVFNALRNGSSFTNFDTRDLIIGGGIEYALRTAVGPINLTLGMSNQRKRPTVSANLGYWF
ncbi:MAG: patatin-like phospholipase family protein [Prevotellaceae bacterium]|jgi:NTE family protein|nr:patatin-like phospholipase family protein [Prevotellaceae bacterium]